MTLQILQYNQDACWPSSDALLFPLLTQKQPKYRNLQSPRMEKVTNFPPLSRKLQLYRLGLVEA